MDIQQLFAEAARLEASDIHLLVGFAPMLRVSGALRAIGGLAALTAADTEALTFATFSPQQKDLFLTNREIDYSIASPAGRFRANVYYQKGTIGAVFRLVPAKIRSID